MSVLFLENMEKNRELKSTILQATFKLFWDMLKKQMGTYS